MWTSASELKEQLKRCWDKGELLRPTNAGQWPLRLSLKTPRSADVSDRFDEVRRWATTLAATPHLRLQWHEVRHRVQGLQQLPCAAWVDSLDDALNWLGKRSDHERFCALREESARHCPPLLAWLDKRPLLALELANDWPQLLAIVAWLKQHPRPNVYLRQIDLPDIHSKFIEQRRALLAELLDLALPPTSIDSSHCGVAGFAARYGFCQEPTLIRFRPLDPALSPLAGISNADITLDAESFSRLAIRPQRVIITENKTNFLALLPQASTLAIFGAGYGWEQLARAEWLNRCPLYYWGDIDTHGFAILNQLRGYFSQVQSLLMDHTTFEHHRPLWGHEDKPCNHELPLLTVAESALYNDLRDQRFGTNLRLEQERISFTWVETALSALMSAGSQ